MTRILSIARPFCKRFSVAVESRSPAHGSKHTVARGGLLQQVTQRQCVIAMLARLTRRQEERASVLNWAC